MSADLVEPAVSESSVAPPGIEPDALAQWILDRDQAAIGPLRFRLLPGGHSNLTYEVRDARGRRWALRRPPLYGTLPSAHDVTREYRIIVALHPTDIPVPRPVGCCADPEVTGAPFYLMEFVDGLVLRDREAVTAALENRAMVRAAEQMVAKLAAIHTVGPDEVGLDDLGKRTGYVERQLHRWITQWRASDADAVPLAERVYERLAAQVPDQPRAGIVHGDFRLDNLVISDSGDIRAVLDWELATLGDTRADLGMLMVYWPDAATPVPSLRDLPHAAPGMPPRQRIVEVYENATGADLSTLAYFEALGYWKLATICQGVYTRYTSGAQGQHDADVSGYPELVRQLLGAASRLL